MKRTVYPLTVFFAVLFLVSCTPDASKFDDYVALGQTELRTGEWKKAATHLERAARIHPGDGRLQYNLGLAQLRSNRLHAAGKALEAASGCSTLDPHEIVDVLLALARVRADQRRWVDAEDALSRAMTIAPAYRQPDILAAFSGLEYRQKNKVKARDYAAAALEENPDHPAALYNLGCTLLYLFEERSAACRAFNRYCTALSGFPAVEAPEELGDHRALLQGVQEGPVSQAVETIQSSRNTLSPSDACTVARDATREDPLNPETWRNYAEICARNQDFAGAKAAYQHLVRLSPDAQTYASIPAEYKIESPAPHLLKAKIAMNSQNLAAAESHYRKALEADSKCLDALLGLENISFQKNDLDGTLDMALQALGVRPNDPEILFRIGCYLAGNAKREHMAIPYYRRFLQNSDGTSERAVQVSAWLRKKSQPQGKDK